MDTTTDCLTVETRNVVHSLIQPWPDGSFVSTGVCNLEIPGSKPVAPDTCHRGCAYIVPQTVQRPGVYSAVYGTVHYKESLKSFGIRVGHRIYIDTIPCSTKCQINFSFLLRYGK